MLCMKNVLQRQVPAGVRSVSQLVEAVLPSSKVAAGSVQEGNNLPYKNALRHIEQEVTLSFKDLTEKKDEFAAGLVSAGWKAGDTLAVWLPNTTERVIVELAAATIGVRVASMDTESIVNADDLAFVLKDSEAKGMVYHAKTDNTPKDAPNMTAIVQEAIPELAEIGWEDHILKSAAAPSLREVISTGYYDKPGVALYRNMGVNGLQSRDWKMAVNAVTKDSVLEVAYKKEGSQVKKSTPMTQSAALEQTKNAAKKAELTALDKVCLTKASGSGISISMLAALMSNAQLILPSESFDDAAINKAMDLESCNVKGDNASELKRL